MNLPPILDIIRGCSESEYRMMQTVRRANRPHNKGERNNPYDNAILHYSAGTGMQFVAPTMASIDLVTTESERINELTIRVADLEKQLAELKTLILDK